MKLTDTRTKHPYIYICCAHTKINSLKAKNNTLVFSFICDKISSKNKQWLQMS